MGFTLKPATREKINLLFAIAGPSGSGKTYSALLLASGIAGKNGKIAVIDTEAGRALQYAPKNGGQANMAEGTFNFLHLDFTPPFTPERYVEAIQTCEQAGATVIVIDSMSHEYNGEGGLVEMADEIALKKSTDKNGKTDFAKLARISALSWAEPKKRHKRMMAKLIQVRSHIIFCLRAEDKIKINRKEKGAAEIVPAGFQPICEKGFMFEMTASMTMNPENPGCPDYELDHKLNNDMRKIFPMGKKLTLEQGALLKQWAESASAGQHRDATPTPKDAENRLQEFFNQFTDWVNKAETHQALEQITANERNRKYRERIRAINPEMDQKIQAIINRKLTELDNAPGMEPEHGDSEPPPHLFPDEMPDVAY